MTDPNTATIRQLVDDCRERLEKELCELVDELVPALVERVRALAVSTRDEGRRAAIIGLQIDLAGRLKNLAPMLRNALRRRAEQASRRGAPTQDLATLHILSDDEESAERAMRDLVDQVDAACSEEINALERRIAHLVMRHVLPQGDASFRVGVLLGGLESACTQVFPDAGQRAELLRLLVDPLVDELPSLYRAINETLIDAGILPRLKRNFGDAPSVDPATAAAESARMVGTIEKLAKARADAAGDAKAAIDAAAASEAFMASLKALDVAGTTKPTGAHTNVVRLAQGSEAARNVRAVESVTLDIIAELFDLIFGDEHVADAIKTLVGGLQTQVLKVAMADQRFFADRGHPTRRFLDSISAIAIRWGRVVDANDPFYSKLSELVGRIQRDFDGDVAVFDAANAELANFLAAREQEEAKASQALAEAVRAREEDMRLQREGQLRAQKAADQAVLPLLAQDMPVAIEQFLASYWRDVLQARIFTSGPDGAPVADALRVAGELLLSVEPKYTGEEHKLKVAALPTLLKQLNTGLDEIGTSVTERSTFMDALVELQLAALRGDKRPANAAPKPPRPKPVARPSATLQVTHATPEGVRVQDISLSADEAVGEAAPDRAELRRVRQLVRGDWVDFITAGQSRRERLTWISPSRALLVFSNRAAECAISITPEALAVRLKNQTAKLVKGDAPIFERALKGAVLSLGKRS